MDSGSPGPWESLLDLEVLIFEAPWEVWIHTTMSASSSTDPTPIVSATAKARAAAIDKMYESLENGAGPWVLYENGTVVLLSRTMFPAKDRNSLIRDAAKSISVRLNQPFAGELNTTVWTAPLPGGRIVVTKRPWLDGMPIVDVLPGEPPADHTADAAARREKDLKEQVVALTSIDPR